jgi:hypothetical protein
MKIKRAYYLEIQGKRFMILRIRVDYSTFPWKRVYDSTNKGRLFYLYMRRVYDSAHKCRLFYLSMKRVSVVSNLKVKFTYSTVHDQSHVVGATWPLFSPSPSMR